MRHCSIKGCDLRHVGLGYCNRHYRRLKRHGDPLSGGVFMTPKKFRECNMVGCASEYLSSGYCRLHYERSRRGSDLKAPKHGAEMRTAHPLYTRYKSMLRRCNSSGHKAYEYYGARGIKICDRWLGKEGFTNFCLDMGACPKDYTLDRVDNNGDYSPDNCRWASKSDQQHNRGISRNNTSGCTGVVWLKNIKKWKAEIYINGKTIRLGKYLDIEEAVKSRKEAEIRYFGR